MTNEYREAPRPTYNYEVNELIQVYQKALKDIRGELNNLLITDFERAQILATEKSIQRILKELRSVSGQWVSETMTWSATAGVAETIFSLGIVKTYEEALHIAKFNKVNRRLVDAIIADTQSDLLAVTQNVERKVKAVIRQASAEVLRGKMAIGINGTQSLRRALEQELYRRMGETSDMAIIDAVGRKWKLSSYTEMLVRTKTMEAHREAAINEAIEREVEYGVISRHGALDACRKWEGRIVSLTMNASGNFPYIEDLPRNEIFHPNCRHLVTPVRRTDRLPADIRELNGI